MNTRQDSMTQLLKKMAEMYDEEDFDGIEGLFYNLMKSVPDADLASLLIAYGDTPPED